MSKIRRRRLSTVSGHFDPERGRANHRYLDVALRGSETTLRIASRAGTPNFIARGKRERF